MFSSRWIGEKCWQQANGEREKTAFHVVLFIRFEQLLSKMCYYCFLLIILSHLFRACVFICSLLMLLLVLCRSFIYAQPLPLSDETNGYHFSEYTHSIWIAANAWMLCWFSLVCFYRSIVCNAFVYTDLRALFFSGQYTVRLQRMHICNQWMFPIQKNPH